LTILPFEKDWYANQGISHVEYVGNPLAGEVRSTLTKAQFCTENNLDSQKPIVALLAGSRHKEVVKILPVLLEAARLMKKKNADLQFVIALASTRSPAEIEATIADTKRYLPQFTIVQDKTREALNAADVAAVTSGTATLETAIIGTPMAIVYKTSWLNYGLLRPLISVEHFGLINLIAEERLVKELIQKDFTAQTLSDELLRLLQPEMNKKMREKLCEATARLGKGGASRRAAEAIMRELET